MKLQTGALERKQEMTAAEITYLTPQRLPFTHAVRWRGTLRNALGKYSGVLFCTTVRLTCIPEAQPVGE